MAALAHFVIDDFVNGEPLPSRVGEWSAEPENNYTITEEDDLPRDPRRITGAKAISGMDFEGFTIEDAAELVPSMTRVRSYEMILSMGSANGSCAPVTFNLGGSDYFDLYLVRSGGNLTGYLGASHDPGVETFEFAADLNADADKFFHLIVSVDLSGNSVLFFLNGNELSVTPSGALFDPDDYFDFDPLRVLFGGNNDCRMVELMIHDQAFTESSAMKRSFHFRTLGL